MVTPNDKAYAEAFRVLALGMTCPDEELALMVEDGAIERAMGRSAESLGLSQNPCEGPWSFAGAKEAACLDLLRREYTRLFVAPTGCVVAPWETAFLDPAGEKSEFGPQLVRTAAADDARRFYRSCGLDLAKNEAADHMRIELEFAALVLGDAEDSALGQDGAEVFLSFWSAHLSRWMVPFFEEVAREARCGFYKSIGQFGAEVGTALVQEVL